MIFSRGGILRAVCKWAILIGKVWFYEAHFTARTVRLFNKSNSFYSCFKCSTQWGKKRDKRKSQLLKYAMNMFSI